MADRFRRSIQIDYIIGERSFSRRHLTRPSPLLPIYWEKRCGTSLYLSALMVVAVPAVIVAAALVTVIVVAVPAVIVI